MIIKLHYVSVAFILVEYFISFQSFKKKIGIMDTHIVRKLRWLLHTKDGLQKKPKSNTLNNNEGLKADSSPFKLSVENLSKTNIFIASLKRGHIWTHDLQKL